MSSVPQVGRSPRSPGLKGSASSGPRPLLPASVSTGFHDFRAFRSKLERPSGELWSSAVWFQITGRLRLRGSCSSRKQGGPRRAPSGLASAEGHSHVWRPCCRPGPAVRAGRRPSALPRPPEAGQVRSQPEGASAAPVQVWTRQGNAWTSAAATPGLRTVGACVPAGPVGAPSQASGARTPGGIRGGLRSWGASRLLCGEECAEKPLLVKEERTPRQPALRDAAGGRQD